MTSAKASRPSSAAAPATTASSRPCRPPRAVYAKGASEARHGFAGTRRTLGVWGPSRGPHLNSAEAERCLVVDAQGAEAHLAADRSAKASRPSSAAAPATTASSRPCRPPRAVYAKGASEARHGFAGTRRTLGVWGPSRGPHLNSAEAERCLVVDAQGAEAHLAAD